MKSSSKKVYSIIAIAFLTVLQSLSLNIASAGTPINSITVGSHPCAIFADSYGAWVTNAGDGTISQISNSSNSVINTFDSMTYDACGITSDGSNLWVVSGLGPAVTKINLSTGEMLNHVCIQNCNSNLSPQADAISFDGKYVWVAEIYQPGSPGSTGSVTQIDPETSSIVRRIPLPSGAFDVSSDGQNVWVSGGRNIYKVNIESGLLNRIISTGETVNGLTSDGTYVWVASWDFENVTQINATTGATVRTISVGKAGCVIADKSHVWVGTNLGVTEISSKTGSIIQKIATGYSQNGHAYSCGIASNGKNVWVTTGDHTVSEFAIGADPVTTTTTAPLVKRTINCVKGKITKKVTAVSPTCPAGYKKK
jgi:hypothetical protein